MSDLPFRTSQGKRMTPKQRAMVRPFTTVGILGTEPDPRWLIVWLNKNSCKPRAQPMVELVSALCRSLTLWAQIMDKGEKMERLMAVTVADLWTTGSLRRIRLCEQCKEKWFLGEHRNYRFCGQRCREAFFRSTEEAKKKGRLRQKKYRENIKRMEKNMSEIR